MNQPSLIEFSKIGASHLGYISVAQNSDLPFEIKRVYWTYFTPDSVIRGHHAHRNLQQLIFATSGQIEFTLEDTSGTKTCYNLDSPTVGLFIPCFYWRTIKFSHNAVLMCLASMEYDEQDYIRSYEEFKSLKPNEIQ
ncbi:FdtA/QdtA family cupin domain-containing protein [Hymenobacter sp. BT664]|uniref:FdtA/QdtA family cupin domain-containing protein n=1 Tax=Hymenobacter montanus TaxID=2771359 RepID=A0A927GHK4_9BACT|nr:FdtA/QdtA family cupin domain-containing protein [Hymenobacter montanus]MBD2766422.1 FdtA/QdtA family cupin domain-containing protein [Hymenobacter montanus]